MTETFIASPVIAVSGTSSLLLAVVFIATGFALSAYFRHAKVNGGLARPGAVFVPLRWVLVWLGLVCFGGSAGLLWGLFAKDLAWGRAIGIPVFSLLMIVGYFGVWTSKIELTEGGLKISSFGRERHHRYSDFRTVRIERYTIVLEGFDPPKVLKIAAIYSNMAELLEHLRRKIPSKAPE